MLKILTTMFTAKNIKLWLFVFFTLFYLFNGIRFIDTLVYDYDGLLFHTDTAEVAEDITEFQTRNHGDTNVHPLFVLFVNPFGALLGSFLPTPIAIVILNSLVGALTVLLAYGFFQNIGLPRYQSALWSMVMGCSASQVLFASLPERHIFAAFSVTFMCYMFSKYPERAGKLIWAGVIALGVTVTNVFQCFLLYFASLFHQSNDETERKHDIKTLFTSCLKYGLTVIIISVGLSLVQKAIWPDARYFFVPGVYGEETEFMSRPESIQQASTRFTEIVLNIFCYNIAAPKPAIVKDRMFHPLTLPAKSFMDFSLMGWISIAGWVLILVTCFFLTARTIRKPRKWFWLQAAITACILFNIGMHMIYGDDFFLYTVNWTFPIIAMVAAATIDANRSSSIKLTVNALLSYFVLLLFVNNAMFSNRISSYFRNGDSSRWAELHGEDWERTKDIERFIEKNGIKTVYADNKHKWLSFAMDRKVDIVNVANEASPKLKITAEYESTNYAFLFNTGNVLSFIDDTRGTYKKQGFAKHVLYYEIIPPAEDLHPLVSEIESIQSSCRQSSAANTVDLNMDTAWTGDNPEQDNDSITFNFKNKTLVSAIKLFSKSGEYPLTWRVKARETRSGEWKDLTPLMKAHSYFWSGPRLFWNGRHYHMEARFIPVTIESLKIVFPANNENRPPVLSEVMILRPDQPAPAETTSLPILLSELEEKKIKKLYCERWTASAVHRRTRGKVQTTLEPYIFEHKRSRKQPPVSQAPWPIYLKPDTAILVKLDYAPIARQCIKMRGYEMRETTIGPWVLFDFRKCEWMDVYSGYSGLYWGGVTCFTSKPNGESKIKAAELTKLAKQSKDETTRHDLIEQALFFYPDYQDALITLKDIHSKWGVTNKVKELEARIDGLTRPEAKTEASFGKRITLKGYTISARQLRPGRKAYIDLFWNYSPDKKHYDKWAVFVHLQHDGKTICQADHILGETFDRLELLTQGKNEVIRQRVSFYVPHDAPEGEYRIFMGVYDKITKERLKAKSSSVKQADKGIRVPKVFDVSRGTEQN